ncbi:CAP domain-containing protein [Variovorax sp. LjRoot290]|uniref:CAP domain-containing protein n=1 Tax=Variovorax sp. LjRoot290 TaxID=3342316 RepID=UPI003ECD3046
MLVLLNEERRKHGLRPLKADPQALETARAHSSDMFARSYFSHITPDGRTPFDRMRRAGVDRRQGLNCETLRINDLGQICQITLNPLCNTV